MFFQKISKFQNFEFSLFFSSIFFSGKNRIFLVPIFFSTKSFRIFFDETFFDKIFSDHLFRSQMIPRFRKSHLEQRATIIKIRTTRTKKKLIFFALFTVRPRPGRTRFVNLLYSTTLVLIPALAGFSEHVTVVGYVCCS